MNGPVQQQIKRKAWVYKAEPLPGIKDLFAGKDERQAFSDYWLRRAPFDALDIACHFAFKALPSNMASRLGAKLGKFIMPRLYRTTTKRAKDNIKRLRPDLTKAQQHDMLIAYQESQGRLLTEISVVSRLNRDTSRVEVHGMEKFIESASRGPIISIGMHLSNWEIGCPVFTKAGFRPHVNYVPPKERGKSWIISRVRQKSGVQFLPPGIEGIRPALTVLKQGGLVSVFCDEGFDSKIRGPFFDCEPHLHGNLAHVARLARMSGATLCPWYCLRQKDFTFKLQALEPIRLPEGPRTAEQLEEDIRIINAAIEPIILANLDQWYFLNNRLGPKKKRP